ncbi:squalene/phytoene synthase family protein [Pseudaestuariivita rosea]|uniref:squalene/phytoene synthase family protein n=1 Tax=Pseudaestuariivita rosea TaxID=2763263 RepID=UPI001ABB40A9|nr:squalene/phytoene synthase family protein [Pseudaestuariivita rosea]
MSFEACAALVERADPDRFLATMAAPVSARRVLFPLYAFNVEVSRAPWVTAEPMIAEMRLQWWRDALEEIGQGGAIRRHEVVDALAPALDAQAVGLLDELIMGRRWDIYKDAFEDKKHFDDYIHATSGHLMWVAARALGQGDETVVRDYAYAAGLANWFVAIPQLEKLGRMPLVDGRPEAVKALAVKGLQKLKTARQNRSLVGKSARPSLYAGWKSDFILSKVARDPGVVGRGELQSSDFSARLRLLMTVLTGRW